MKLSYNWLKEYLPIDLTPQQLADTLTSLGLEVESVEPWYSVPGGLKGVIIGEVITCKKHPNADKLSITNVYIGQDQYLNIVCGAPNVRQGQKVAVATAGTTLYKKNESFTIEKTKIRGESSEGMICSQMELGLGDDHSGILVLDSSAIPGTPAAEYFGIVSDMVYEIAITPNRIDCASHYGVARDLAARLSLSSPVRLIKPSVSDFSVDYTSDACAVMVESKACHRYTGVSLSGVTVAPSPAWLQNKLRAVGLTPINNIVDITNFILYELGQPLHAFDADKINGRRVIIKTLPEGTPFITLDGVERKLTAEDLMICDDREGMCIAGILGGAKSGITSSTKNVFLESAWFDSVSIRKSSKRHGLSTDASFRFERGTDPDMVPYALMRAAALIRSIAGGKISSEITDIYPVQANPAIIQLSFKRITARMGVSLGHDRILQILNALDIKILNESSDEITVAVPPFRVDVKTEADIVEELLRIHGYNEVEISSEVTFSPSTGKKTDTGKLQDKVSDMLAFGGMTEIICNSLTRSAYYEGTPLESSSIHIINALSRDLNTLRQTLLYGALETIRLNVNHKNSNLQLFEFGYCYTLGPLTGSDPLSRYNEQLHLGLCMHGFKTEKNWTTDAVPLTFFTLKAWVERIFTFLGFSLEQFQEGSDLSYWSEGGLSYSLKGIKMAEAGIVHNNILQRFDLRQPVYFAEINWSALMPEIKPGSTRYRELPRFPEVRRDLALLIDKNVTFRQLKELAWKTEKNLLRDMWLFDIYEDEKLGQNKKSYAVAFILRHDNKTLTDAEVDQVMNKIISAYAIAFNAQLR